MRPPTSLQHLARHAIPWQTRRALLDMGRSWQTRHERWRERDRRDQEQIDLVLAATMGDGATGIDVGANEGRFVRTLCRVAPRGRHLAFEPVPAMAERLRREFPNVDVRAIALGNDDTVAPFEVIEGHEALSSLHPDRDLTAFTADATRRRIEVTVRRLDDVLDPDSRPAVVKIDVEGAELAVIQGATRTLRRARPTIVVEHGRGNPTVSTTFFEVLDGLDYIVFDIDGQGPYATVDAFLGRLEAGGMWNWLARPRHPEGEAIC